MEKESLLDDAVETSALLGRPASTGRSYSTTIGTSQSRAALDGTVIFSQSLSHHEISDG